MSVTYRSPIFALSDQYISEVAELSPITATSLGVSGHEDELDDFSLAGWEIKTQHLKRTLEKLIALAPQDDVDRIAQAVMRERLESELALHESLERQLSAAVISSPVIWIRQTFEMMPSASADDIEVIARRLRKVGKAHESWISGLEQLAGMVKILPRRQATGIAEQLESFAQGAYSNFAKGIDSANKYPDLHEAAKSADISAGSTAKWFIEKYIPQKRQIYALGS